MLKNKYRFILFLVLGILLMAEITVSKEMKLKPIEKVDSKDSKVGSKFFSVVFLFRNSPEDFPENHWQNSETTFKGLKDAIEALNDIYTDMQGKPSHFPAVIGLCNPPTKPEYEKFIKEQLSLGSELGIAAPGNKESIAKAMGVNPDRIITKVADWEQEHEPWRTWTERKQGFKVRFTAVLEGDSLLGETIDMGNNYEGRPFFPYYVQMRRDNPAFSAAANREMSDKEAPLDLFWLARTPWSTYDRFCFQYSFHVNDIRIGGKPWLCQPDNVWFWKNELQQWQENLDQGLVPFAHISICNESHLFAIDEATQVPDDTGLRLLIEQVRYLLENGWQPVTGKEFYEWYSQQWPCPEVPNQLVLFEDTSKAPDGNFYTHITKPGEKSVDMGHILLAETKYFRVSDHQHRLSPFMEVAYELETPNLFQAGYAGHDGRVQPKNEPHSGKTFADGTGFVDDPKTLSVTAATGNALFWGTDPHREHPSKWDYFAQKLGVEPLSKNRCYSLLIDGKDVQFPAEIALSKPYGDFFDLKRNGDEVSWKKRVHITVEGKGAELVISHTLKGKDHIVEYIDETGKLEGHKFTFVFRPFFYPGWLLDQEIDVFGFAPGMKKAFEYKTDNKADISVSNVFEAIGDKKWFTIYHNNPTHPEMNRAVEVSFPDNNVTTLEFYDYAGSSQFVEARVNAKRLGRFVLRYRRMFSRD